MTKPTILQPGQTAVDPLTMTDMPMSLPETTEHPKLDAPAFIPPGITIEPRYPWIALYRAGIKADIEKQPRTPPEWLNKAEQSIWLQGYDR